MYRLYRSLLSVCISFDCSLSSLFDLGLPVQVTQIGLPANSDEAGEDAPILRVYEGETESRNRGPQFAAVDYGNWHGAFDAFPDLGERVA